MLAWGGGSGETETSALTLESVGGEATGVACRIAPRQ